MNENLEINNLFKKIFISELFDEYDSIKGMVIEDNNEIKTINDKKSEEIIEKIKFIQNELKNNLLINITGLAFNIQQLLNKRMENIEIEKDKYKNNDENKYSEYNDVKENLFNILSKEEIIKDKNNNGELIKMDNTITKNNMEVEPIFPMKKEENNQNLLIKNKEEIKKEQLTGKKRPREKKKKEKEIDKEDNNKKKNKKKKVNNKENENNNINNSLKEKGVKKGKDENMKNKKQKKESKQNNKNNRYNNIKNLLNSKTNSKNENQSRKNSNSNSKRSKKRETQLEPKRNNRTPKKQEERKPTNKLIEEILKREFELNSKLSKQKDQNKNKENNIDQNKKKEINKDNNNNDTTNINTNNTNTLLNNNGNIKPKYPKVKKKGKKKIIGAPLIIDEELKKSTPIRNLKKQPKSILKKIVTNPLPSFPDMSTTPIKFKKAKSSEKSITLSSESKNKKFKSFAEIFQSPSKLKATPLKRKVNSEKKSNLKITNILTAEEKSEKKDFDGKKRNISFNDERIVKEYNPKTPVRDVKQRITRKSPLERKNRNDLIK